jgi:hypothetical protein
MTEAFWYSPTLFSKKFVFPLHRSKKMHKNISEFLKIFFNE